MQKAFNSMCLMLKENVRHYYAEVNKTDGILQRKYLISLFYGDVENFKKSENKNYDDL